MSTPLTVQITPQGLLIPRQDIREWLERGIEVIRDEDRIVIRPRPAPRTERERILYLLEASGLVVNAPWSPTSPPVSSDELDELAQKFSVGQPLSEIIVEEREERW